MTTAKPASVAMHPTFLDSHPNSPVQIARFSEWAKSSREGVRCIETSSVCFRIRQGGNTGPSIVFFADGPNALEHHDEVFDRLTRWARVTLVDPPGFGFSTLSPDFDFTLKEFTASYIELLDAIGPGPHIACPTCTNVYPIAQIAASHPKLLSHLILMQALEWEQEKAWTGKIVDPAGALAAPYAGQELNYRTRAGAPGTWYPNAVGKADMRDWFTRQACECFSHGGNFCLASLIQSWFGPDSEAPVFPPFAQPTLVVFGAEDRSHRRSDKRSLLQIAPHARYIERTGVGHFPEIEDPDWFQSLLTSFLDGTLAPDNE